MNSVSTSASRLSLYLSCSRLMEQGKMSKDQYHSSNLVRLHMALLGYENFKKYETWVADENYKRVMNRIRELADEFFEKGAVSDESLDDFDYLLLRSTQAELGIHAKELDEQIKAQEQGEDHESQ